MLLQCAMAGKSSVLLLTDDVVLDLAAVLSANRDIGVEAISEDEVAVITQCETLGNFFHFVLININTCSWMEGTELVF